MCFDNKQLSVNDMIDITDWKISIIYITASIDSKRFGGRKSAALGGYFTILTK